MAKVDIKFTNNASDVLNALQNQLITGLEAVGLTAEGYAKDNCPVDTGRLRNSITNQVIGTDVYIGSNVEYAKYVEYGAKGRKPVHFLQQAAANHTQEYKQLIESALKA